MIDTQTEEMRKKTKQHMNSGHSNTETRWVSSLLTFWTCQMTFYIAQDNRWWVQSKGFSKICNNIMCPWTSLLYCTVQTHKSCKLPQSFAAGLPTGSCLQKPVSQSRCWPGYSYVVINSWRKKKKKRWENVHRWIICFYLSCINMRSAWSHQ